MVWIKTISEEDATGRLESVYKAFKRPNGKVASIIRAHSLRPHALEGHTSLFKHVLMHAKNTIPRWFAEAIGVYVSSLAGCAYCVQHHTDDMRYLIGDDGRTFDLRDALINNRLEDAFEQKQVCALGYAGKLAMDPSSICETHIQELRDAGYNDGEILEINQITAYFAYANRTVLGLGVSLHGEYPKSFEKVTQLKDHK